MPQFFPDRGRPSQRGSRVGAPRDLVPWGSLSPSLVARLPMLRRNTSEPHRICLHNECGNNHRTHKISHTVAADTNLSMSAPSPESPTPTAVGPRPSRALRRHAVPMSPEALPVEIWHIIIMYLDDRCFAWFVLRQTCPFLAHVTEDVFARCLSRTCSLRFAGQTLTRLIPPDLRGDTQSRICYYHTPQKPLPSFRFQPSSFAPASTKARLVLKLSSPATAQDTLSLHQTYAGTVDWTSRLTQLFFQPGAVADAERNRLLNQAQFVRFDGQLKSLRLPSPAIDVTAQELSLDWRQLCHVFMRDQFKCRFVSGASVTWWRQFP